MEFDYNLGIIRFRKNDSLDPQNNLFLDLDLRSQDNEIYPCVNLYKNGDCVEIINNQELSF